MEAMALGKPLIVSDNGGLPELVDDGRNGYIYHAADGADALANCICKFDSLAQTEYETMAKCSLDKAKQMFSPERYIEKIEGYYAEYRS